MRPGQDQKGQALLEALVTLPAVIVFLTAASGIIAMMGLRLELIFTTQELATCALSTNSESRCRRLAAAKATDLFELWGFHEISVRATLQEAKAQLRSQAQWGPYHLRWDLQETTSVHTP